MTDVCWLTPNRTFCGLWVKRTRTPFCLPQPFCVFPVLLKRMLNFIKTSKRTLYKTQVISFWSTSFKLTAQNNSLKFNMHTSAPFEAAYSTPWPLWDSKSKDVSWEHVRASTSLTVPRSHCPNKMLEEDFLGSKQTQK